MQNDRAQSIVNSIRKKQKCTITVVEKCDKNGVLRINLNPEFTPTEPNATYSISLIKFAAINNITNVNAEKNKFIYTARGRKKTLTLPNGFYSTIEEYNKEIKRQIGEQNDNPENITLTVNNATGLVCVNLAEHYVVHFNEKNTFRDNLGFDSEELRGDRNHEGKRICNLLPTQSIFIHCSVVRGNIVCRNKTSSNSDILFDFPFNYTYGAPMTFQLSPNITESELDLSVGKIREIIIKFLDDNENPVIFGDDPISLTLRIKQD